MFEGKLILNRTEGSHKILGALQVAMRVPWRGQPASTANDFLYWLKSVNELVMQSRLGKNLGESKRQNNQAGALCVASFSSFPVTVCILCV